MISFYLNTTQNLAELDTLYKSVVSGLRDADKKEYCISLRYRLQEDLGRTHCAAEKQALKKLLKAVEKELTQF